jgi:formylglycine-generating enzyme required for sulfatase activity
MVNTGLPFVWVAVASLVAAVANGGQPATSPAAFATETRKVKVVTPDKPDGIEKEITYRKNSIGMEFVRIESGEFMMGSPEQECSRGDYSMKSWKRSTSEGPRHRVRITKPFLMGATEVTQAQWKEVMGTTVEQLGNGKPGNSVGPDIPMYLVSWNDATEFCKRLSARDKRAYRLPTEAEWEYACRGGTTTPFYMGETTGRDQAHLDHNHVYGKGRPAAESPGNVKGLKWGQYAPVASFPANPWGLYDMSGSVAEWCSDYFKEDYYAVSPVDDPQGPDETQAFVEWGQKCRVVRGGRCCDPAHVCRSASRSRRGQVGRGDSLHGAGFRVCVDADAAAEGTSK